LFLTKHHSDTLNILKDIATVSNYQPQSGDLLKLFRLVIVEDVAKEEAATLFPSTGYFRKTYKNLKDRLLDGILLNSFKGLSRVQEKHFQIRRRAMESTMLIHLEKKKAGIKVAEETYYLAEKYGLIDVALAMSRELEVHYGSVELSTVKWKKFRTSTKKYRAYFDAECQAQSLFGELAHCYQKKHSIAHIPEELKRLSLLCKNNKELRFRFYYYSVKNLYYRILEDTQQIIANCREAILFFENIKVDLSYLMKWSFAYQLLPIYIQQGSYGKSELMVNKCLSYCIKGTYNWHLTLFYKVVSGFYSNKPAISLQACLQAKSVTKKFDSQAISERWKLIEAYLSFFSKLGKINYTTKFRLYRFLNEVKFTNSLNLMIIELLTLLINGKKKMYMQRSERIEDVIQANRGYPRAAYFLRMLRAVELGDYNRIRVSIHAKKHVGLLTHSKNKKLSLSIYDTEPVPYEILWESVLEFLEKK